MPDNQEMREDGNQVGKDGQHEASEGEVGIAPEDVEIKCSGGISLPRIGFRNV